MIDHLIPKGQRELVDYVLFDDATGEILRTGVCTLYDLPAQAGAGQTVLIQADVNDAAKIVDLATGTVVDKPEPTKEEVIEAGWKKIRQERDLRLLMSDWTQLADAPLTSAELLAWTQYRVALRNLTTDYESPDDVVWPQEPGGGRGKGFRISPLPV